jgi:hypothetical protein
LAASCMPLVKSKARATAMMKTMNPKPHSMVSCP